MERVLRPRVAVVSTSVVLSLLVAGVIGGTTASAQGDIHVAFPYKTWTQRYIDWKDDRQAGLGDRIELRGPLFDVATPADRVGFAYGTCLVVRKLTRDSGLFRCTYALKLADGTVTVDGIDPAGPGVYELGVTGGTGAYNVANGEATVTDTNKATEFQITFGP